MASPILLLLIEAAALGDDSAVDKILNEERMLSIEEASRPDLRQNSTSYGLTALHRAKTPEVARVLLDFGVDVNVRGPLGQSPLHTCCDNPPVLKLLLERGANIGATTADGSTALEWAVVADSLDSVRLLLEKGANVQSANANGNTCLHLVSSKKMAELLLAHGAKVSVENKEGKIPLETAAERQGEPDFAAITELLLDVSEDRGLRYRSKRKSSAQIKTVDSFGEPEDSKAKVKKRWSLVRQKFLTNFGKEDSNKRTGESKLASIIAGRTRSGSVAREWHNEEPLEGQEVDSTRNTRNGSFVDNRRLAEAQEEEDTITAGPPEDDDIGDGLDADGFYTRFFELAIRERPFLAKKMLDRHRTFLFAKGTAKYYLYDLSLLGGIDSVSDALRYIVEYDRRDLVAHDVVQWLVTAKWGLFTQHQVFREAALYFMFIILFILTSMKPFFPKFVAEWQPLIDFGLFLLSLRYLSRLLLEWFHRARSYRVAMSIFRADRFTGPVYVIVIFILIARYMFGLPENSFFARVMETMGSVMLWVRVLYFAEAQFQPVGLTMSIVRRMIADITVYVAVQMVFLIGFAHAMTIAFRGQEPRDTNFGSPSTSFVTLGFFIFNVNQDTVFNVEDPDRRTLAMVLLAIYESLVVVLFLNLVIAVMTTSFEDVMSNARTEWLLVRAKICVRMEDQTSAHFFTSSAKRHLKKLKKKKSAVVMERASGENEVSLPVALRPPPFVVTETIVKIVDVVKRISCSRCFRRRTRDEYTPIGQSQHQVSNVPYQISSPARRIQRQSSEGVVDAMTGQGEETFLVGTFTRYSVTQQQQQQHHQQQSQSQSSNNLNNLGGEDTKGDSGSSNNLAKDPSIVGDDELIKSLRGILRELERRSGVSSA